MNRSLFRLAAVLIAAVAIAPSSAGAATISGDPLLITSDDSNGRLGVAIRGSSTNEFFGGGVADDTGIPEPANAGFVVTLAGTGQQFGSRRGGALEVVSAPVVTGTGVAADPFVLRTTYAALVSGAQRFHIVQELSYVNGSPEFTARYAVVNITGEPLSFRASMGADLRGGGNDRGVGALFAGPPRLVAGINRSSGAVAGLVETTPWSHFEEGYFGNVLQRADSDPLDTSGNVLLDTVDPEEVDNGVAVQWDNNVNPPLNGNSATDFIVRWRFVRAFDLVPDNVDATTGLPVQLSTEAASTEGTPRAGATIRYTVTGSNPMTGSVRTGADGTATIEYTPAVPGFDTVTAYPDLNNNNVQDADEPSQDTRVSIAGPQPPQIGKTANVVPLEGTVKVKLPRTLPKGFKAKDDAWVHAAQSRFTTLSSAQQIPVGSTMDVSRGRFQLATSSKGTATASTIQSASFSPCTSGERVVAKGCQNIRTNAVVRFQSTQSSQFSIIQSARERGLTEVRMAGSISCPRGNRKEVSSAARKRSRALWGKGRGRFRTRGRASSATVRGTEWYSKDTCRGTETRVREGTVIVKDFGRRKNVRVKAGKKYFARYRAKR